jgi:hypothetical protein
MTFITHAGSSKIHSLMRKQFVVSSAILKENLCQARKITICLDGWSKKSLSSSYLGISACYYDVTANEPKHSFLNLSSIQHPHTGDMLSECLSHCLQQWGITEKQVVMIITDNGANMVEAIRLIQEKAQQSAILNDEDPDADDDESQSHESTDAGEAEGIVNEDMDFENAEQDAGQSLSDNEVDDDSDEIIDTEHENQFDLSVQVPYLRMPCMAHSLQLIIKLAYVHYDAVLSKTRRLVAKLRKSSVAVEKLMKKCGKSVVTDCITRWNSTYQMIKRRLVMKNDINYVLSEMGKYNRLFHQLLNK